MEWIPTRQAALDRLAQFLPLAGRDYAIGRNTDRGPLDRSNVSALSPYLRRRMITEEEVAAAVVGHHGFAAAEKFLHEVAWRTYWKGWLEMRPTLFDRYRHELHAAQSTLAHDRRLQRRFESAVDGRTGIDCFDTWVDELQSYGWLHNHARMWFASIWIFTLGLPWQLGADYFYRHLIDADPASNTLSWRWVAGLQTVGKHYLATADNIDRHTLGRFAPHGQLNEKAAALAADDPPPPAEMPMLPDRLMRQRIGLLLTEEDLHPESLPIAADVKAIAILPPPTTGGQGEEARAFSTGALADAGIRAASHFGCGAEEVKIGELAAWAKCIGIAQLVTGYAPVGPVAMALREAAKALHHESIDLLPVIRDWDRQFWPHATAGFFKFKARLPEIVGSLAGSKR